MIRLLICGSRAIKNFDWVYHKIDTICKNQPIDCIITGMANGPDIVGFEYSRNNGLKVLEFPITQADWNRDGKKAGPIRNQKMLVEGKPTHILAFLHKTEKSNGTRHMIRISKEKNIPVKEVYYEGK